MVKKVVNYELGYKAIGNLGKAHRSMGVVRFGIK